MAIRLVLVMLLLGLAGAVAPAQFAAGDLIVADMNGPAVWAVTSQGLVYTVNSSLNFFKMCVASTPDNRSLLVSGFGTGSGHTVRIAPDGTVTSFTNTGFYSLDVDGAGDIIGAGKIYVTRFSKGIETTLSKSGYFNWLRGGAIDLGSGDLVVWDYSGSYYRFSYLQTNTVSPLMSGLVRIPPPYVGLHSDPGTGEMLIAEQGRIKSMPIDQPASTRTLIDITLSSGPDFCGGLVRDPADGTFLVAAYKNRVGQPGAILRFDARQNTLTTAAVMPSIPIYTFGGVTFARGRHLSAQTEPRPGQPYPLLISVPRDPGAYYAAAASFGFRPGIVIGPGRTIPLNPDPLFFTSLTNAGPFTGFQGVLDSRGEATATLMIPALKALSGVRLYAGVVTVANGRISTISDPLGFTIR